MPAPTEFKPTAILLTGATGLVGRFVLQRLLQYDWPVAVIVRDGLSSSRLAKLSAQQQNVLRLDRVRQRIEQVLTPFETQRLLPRPKCIAWDIAQPTASYTGSAPPDCTGSIGQAIEDQLSSDLSWLKDFRLTVIHCAASIRFQLDKDSGEPYRTNVSGTKNLLRFCEGLDIQAFHHVSTAYVGEHRSGSPVWEVVAQDDNGGNDYERSKIAAETLVAEASHIGQVTIHRPSIVIGDSQTGFTSTFHGFYAPLQIGWQYARLFGFSEAAGQWFRQQLGLKEQDSKNLVCVDWVAEGVAQSVASGLRAPLSAQPKSSPCILHWTNPQPVATAQMQRAIVDAIQRDSQSKHAAGKAVEMVSAEGPSDIPAVHSKVNQPRPTAQQFRERMSVYETYFQPDPIFDRTQAARTQPELACPKVDYELLSKLSDWAIRANFGWPKQPLLELPHSAIVKALREFPVAGEDLPGKILNLRLLGCGAPEPLWFIFSAGKWFRAGKSFSVNRQWWQMSLSALAGCITGEICLDAMVGQGIWMTGEKSQGVDLAAASSWINHIRMQLSSIHDSR